MELEKIKNRIVTIQGQQVILDSDVAELYSVETKRINEAVKNNPDKFPTGYIISLQQEDWENLKSKISTSSWGGVRKLPKAFSEKGLYMLATILKSPKATETTIAIIETFAKVRELSRTIAEIGQHDPQSQKDMLQRSGEIISDIIGSGFETTDTETTIELNLAIVSMKHTIKRTSKKK
ncbi:ORF6N domain-containing protein [Parabacteroides sp. OttesenSCG-928-J18]|nr:ORF6N domain-containing protein [Bacteroides sp. OttesenSCG-928-N06]MDL2241604.1 ORF6N domain-containing protein [Bacteroidales bacterium OttesenSCG-928-L03]MDL2245792.1 ORF6N domain-containing protein [Parabacteroides sp. OttesenSCG-928-J18]MDL2305300.1 ORF6N domain-containing protein [Bacteroides sp. OttesenSCG-928-D19]